jgi:hypothetical protein
MLNEMGSRSLWARLWRPRSFAAKLPEVAATTTNTMHGKTALVTGSTDGIGRETALQLRQRDARVFIHAVAAKGGPR